MESYRSFRTDSARDETTVNTSEVAAPPLPAETSNDETSATIDSSPAQSSRRRPARLPDSESSTSPNITLVFCQRASAVADGDPVHAELSTPALVDRRSRMRRHTQAQMSAVAKRAQMNAA